MTESGVGWPQFQDHIKAMITVKRYLSVLSFIRYSWRRELEVFGTILVTVITGFFPAIYCVFCFCFSC